MTPDSKKAPIIFCHYGDTDYLRYTLRCVRRTNPDRRVILLGDESNRWLSASVEHFEFARYSSGKELDVFDRVYRLVQGAKHGHERGGRDWVNFVFKRWYYVYYFAVSQGLGAFWHFDSDNMIVEDLGRHEAKYSDFECTEQCNGSCMNGYVSSPDVVRRYLEKINELFQRQAYMTEQAREFETENPEFAFTEMRAYEMFRQEERIRSIRLTRVIDGAAFDDTLTFAHGMETERLYSGKWIKKVFLHPDGRFLCRDEKTKEAVQLNAINVSWLPLRTYKVIFKHARHRGGDADRSRPEKLGGATIASRVDSPASLLIRRLKSLVKRVIGRR